MWLTFVLFYGKKTVGEPFGMVYNRSYTELTLRMYMTKTPTPNHYRETFIRP